MKLTDVKTVRELLGGEKTVLKKKYGQNFLINEEIVEEIADASAAGKESGVIEIGPGIGTLTSALCKRAKRVCAIEIDSTLVPVLSKTLAEFDNVNVINADVLKCDLAKIIEENFPDCAEVLICANLPYYITTPILMHILEANVKVSSITVMVQKEVADRICAKAGDKNCGAITSVIAYYGEAKSVLTVKAGNFLPAPKVDSAVVRIDLYDGPQVNTGDEKTFFRVIKGAFGQRRKTLLNSLSTEFSELSKSELEQILIESGIDTQIRGEKLTNEDFARLSRNICKKD